MRAIVIHEHGGPEVLKEAKVAELEAGPGQVRVDVSSAGVNFIDIYQRSGAYRTSLPFVAGVEAVGRVSAIGDDVSGFSVGDRVGWVNIAGAYADQALIPWDRLIPIPDPVADETAVAALLQGMTAHYLTHDTYRVQPGDIVLVHAAAGGTGLLLTQLVKRRGGHVIGTVSTEAKEQMAREAGADHIIRPTEVNVAQAVQKITGGHGVAAVFDGIGAPTIDVSLACLRPRGVLAVYGQAGGPVPAVDPQRLNIAGSVFLTRPNLDHHIATRDELLLRSRDVFTWLTTGRIQIRASGRYPLRHAAEAHAHLESRRSAGKLVLYT